MIFKFDGKKGLGFLTAFAEAIGSKVENGYVHFPAELGKGYFRGFDLHPQLKMMIRRYELYADLAIFRTAMEEGTKTIVLAFHNFYTEAELKAAPTIQDHLPTVQITSAGINYEDFFPIHSHVNTVVIAIHSEFLKSLLKPKEDDERLQTIFSGNQAFFYEAFISPEMQEVVIQVLEAKIEQSLSDFYFRVKAEELVYLFFAELLKRGTAPGYPINEADVKLIYAIRDGLMKDLSVPPKLPELAQASGMSESKMKKLFAQIFGTGIYNYYQTLRMNAAARLLSGKGQSVAEIGYLLGFTNLSHFSRLFEKHHGIKPKQYSKR
ncbi:AraC family transcriptional regulator [Pedobacter sp. PLR]|uniref:AraC family transcriptional regulator n=1 Tax=Pedobacter sp. PLR TaxID=2994465 RepID=UPI0022467D68|nr:AraC family transcriptional regulator [Pedobacter sp. PLR]MCX2449780.1 AraC family transcriptional regulator [Pedobacter sp. PLR]